MKKMMQVTSVALIALGLIGCSETNNGKKSTWTEPQLTAFTNSCIGIVEDGSSTAKAPAICQCWVDSVTFDYTFEEAGRDENDDAITKKLDECGERNGEPDLLARPRLAQSILRNINQDESEIPSGVRKALDKVKAKHAKTAPVAPMAPAAPEAEQPADALNPLNGHPAPTGLDAHTQVEGINGEFGGLCVDSSDKKRSSRTSFVISFDKETKKGVVTRTYQQYDGIGCDEAKKNGNGIRLLVQNITLVEKMKPVKVLDGDKEVKTIEGFRFESERTNEVGSPKDRRFGSEVLRLVQIDGRPHLLNIGRISNSKNDDQANLAGVDIFETDKHFDSVQLSSIAQFPRIEKPADVATK